MLTMLFMFFLCAIFGKLFIFAIRAAWGITRILLSIVFLPLTIAGLFFAGAVSLAIPLLIVVGIITLVRSLAVN